MSLPRSLSRIASKTAQPAGPSDLEPERYSFQAATTSKLAFRRARMKGTVIFLLQCPSTNTDSVFFDTQEPMDMPLEVLPGGTILLDSSIKGGKTLGFDVWLQSASGSQSVTIWLFRG